MSYVSRGVGMCDMNTPFRDVHPWTGETGWTHVDATPDQVATFILDGYEVWITDTATGRARLIKHDA